MNREQAIDTAQYFCDKTGRRMTLQYTAVKDGNVFGSDGRIGICIKSEGEDDCPEKYPVDALVDMVFKRRLETAWAEINWAKIGEYKQDFENEFRKEKDHVYRENNRRYSECRCPHCWDKVYWDNDNEELVDAKEMADQVYPKDVDYPVWLCFDGKRILVNFSYLWTIRAAFGLREDFLYAWGTQDHENSSGSRYLWFKTPDEEVQGILAQLRAEGGDENSVKAKVIELEPVTEAGKEQDYDVRTEE